MQHFIRLPNVYACLGNVAMQRQFGGSFFLWIFAQSQKHMKVLIRQAKIIASGSTHNGQILDILISNGIITQVGSITEAADMVVERPNLHVSLGWMDIFAHFNDPGYEQRETLESGAAAAAAGGFTDVMILPNTNPAVSTKSIVEYIRQKAAHLPVHIHPIASVTKNAEGTALTEMYDMHASGAIAFSDGTQSIQNTGVLLKALQYVLPLAATIIQLPDDKSIAPHGLMSEGIESTRLGLAGKPAIAEELMVARDIELLKYTGSKLHITGVSTRKSIELIASAKAAGLQITCSVSPAHLWFCDEDLEQYNSNLKLNPPLRTKDDRMALQQAFNDGSIDCLASHHLPQHWDDKTCEFEYAKNGSTALETCFGVANQFAANLQELVNKLTIAPRNIFGLPLPLFEEGSKACLTLFNPDETFVWHGIEHKSKAGNDAFAGKQLKGRIYGIFSNNQLSLPA